MLSSKCVYWANYHSATVLELELFLKSSQIKMSTSILTLFSLLVNYSRIQEQLNQF